MSKCPIYTASQSSPNKLALVGDVELSYQNLELYVEHLQQKLKCIENHQVIATTSKNTTFIYALLFACLREKKIFFPISYRLSTNQLNKYLQIASAYLIDEIDQINDQSNRNVNVDIDQKQIATYLLTSGSSSEPKICIHSYQNHFYSAIGANEHLNYDENSSWLFSLPPFHVGGLSLFFRTALAKASLYLTSKRIEDLKSFKSITHLSLIPTLLYRLRNNFEKLKNLDCILLGGAYCPQKLVHLATRSELKIYQTYGLTEMASQVATSEVNQMELKCLKYREVKIAEDNEILVRGKTLFMGYLVKGKPVDQLDRAGWFHTGDLGSIENNDLKVLSRKDNQFISGGENIMPEEIEKTLLSHPWVTEAIVVPKEDIEFGHRPIAFIKSDRPLLRESFDLYLQDKLEKFKWPIEYFPLQYGTLKPSRKELKLKLAQSKAQACL